MKQFGCFLIILIAGCLAVSAVVLVADRSIQRTPTAQAAPTAAPTPIMVPMEFAEHAVDAVHETARDGFVTIAEIEAARAVSDVSRNLGQACSAPAIVIGIGLCLLVAIKVMSG